MTKEEEKKMWEEAMDGVMAWEKQISDSVTQVLKEYSIKEKDFEDLMDGSKVNGIVEIVPEPKGDAQKERYGKLKNIHVKQWSVGDSGDSYAGFIYAQLKEEVWLKIPYEC